MSNYAIMRVEKIKSISTATKRQNHNERKHGNALSDRGEHRVVHLRSQHAPQLKEKMSFTDFFKQQTAGQKMRKDAVRGFEVILTFSPNAVPAQDLREWAGENMRFLCDTFGAKNLCSVELHLSETTPHIHALITAIDHRGKLCAKNIIKGPSHLRQIQSDYAERMSRFGLERGISKELTKAQHTELREFYANESQKAERLKAYEKTFGNEKEWNVDTYIKFVENIRSEPKNKPLERKESQER